MKFSTAEYFANHQERTRWPMSIERNENSNEGICAVPSPRLNKLPKGNHQAERDFPSVSTAA
jgi:hypothetical protein